MNNDQPQILITNANIFDGTSEQLATGMSALVEGNQIPPVSRWVVRQTSAM